MLRPDSLSSCACEPEVTLNGRKAIRISLGQVQFLLDGMRLIGEGILAVASRHGLPERLIRDRMKGNLFLVPPSPSLYFLFHVPELDADMHIEIPRLHWSFRELAQMDAILAGRN